MNILVGLINMRSTGTFTLSKSYQPTEESFDHTCKHPKGRWECPQASLSGVPVDPGTHFSPTQGRIPGKTLLRVTILAQRNETPNKCLRLCRCPSKPTKQGTAGTRQGSSHGNCCKPTPSNGSRLKAKGTSWVTQNQGTRKIVGFLCFHVNTNQTGASPKGTTMVFRPNARFFVLVKQQLPNNLILGRKL